MTTLAMIRLTDAFRIFTMLYHLPVRYDHYNVILGGVQGRKGSKEPRRRKKGNIWKKKVGRNKELGDQEEWNKN